MANNKIFLLNSPAGLLAKLKWEVQDFEDSSKPEVLSAAEWFSSVCHAYNCAVTAWHISDWVWHCDASIQPSLPKVLTSWNKNNDLAQFQEAIRQQSIEIAICYQLCTAAKHWNMFPQVNDPTVIATQDVCVQAGPSALSSGRNGFKVNFQVAHSGRSYLLADVFKEADRFWSSFLAKHGLS